MITVNSITKEYGGTPLFSDITFNINQKERIGLAGVNGAGKSTLLKIFSGSVDCETGNIVIPNGINVGYLPQEKVIISKLSVIDEAMLVFGFINDYKNEIDVIHNKLESDEYNSIEYEKHLNRLENLESSLSVYSSDKIAANAEKYLMGLGFKRDDLFRSMKEFSQGWQMRVEIAKLLLLKPQLLLLDEPTNHLDIESIQWVEDFLLNYSGAVVLVSHDRKLLDNVTTRTIEISKGKIYDYKVPYSDYIIQREERQHHLQSTFNNQQRDINEIERFVERFRYKASKAKQVQSRVKLLEKMDKIELDKVDKQSINFLFPKAPHSGKVTIEGIDISKKYGDNKVLSNIDFEIIRGEKIAFLGRNGEGKSTLTRIIANDLDFTGTLKLGHQVELSYFAQDQGDKLDPDLTVFETLDNVAVGEIRKRIKSILGAFLFRGDDVDKKVKVLSGGEKSRLALATMLLTPSNLLLLDEPTNHLDMRSKDILKNALLQYEGTVVIVSHDRDFLSGLTTRIYEFKDKKIAEFRGDIEEFIDKRKLASLHELESKRIVTSQDKITSSNSKVSWENKKELDKKSRKIRTEINKIEKQISDLEEEFNFINEKLSNPDKFSEEIKSGELYKAHDEVELKLKDAYKSWELNTEQLDKK